MDRKAGTFTAFRKSDGLPDDAVYGILEDASGKLWLSTNSGIARFDPNTRKVRSYTMADGLQSNEFNGGAFYQNKRGEMFFGGINGDGVWNEEGAALRIVVNPPWWRTLWAYILYAFLLTGAVYLIVLFERNREREKGELVEAELRAQAAELQSRTVEAEARVLKLENDRKAHELEEARKLQLSMLPTRLPAHPHYAVAARMQTATEVGGDYYDFILGEDGSLTVAMGDATGHGTRESGWTRSGPRRTSGRWPAPPPGPSSTTFCSVSGSGGAPCRRTTT